MTADELQIRIEKTIADGRESGLSDEAIIDVLMDAADALREGLTSKAP